MGFLVVICLLMDVPDFYVLPPADERFCWGDGVKTPGIKKWEKTFYFNIQNRL